MPLSLFETRSGAAWLNLEIDATCVNRGPALRAQLAYCVRFVDNLIDLQRWPLPEQHLDTLLNRRVSFHIVRIGQMILNSGRDPHCFKTLTWLQRWLETVRRCLSRASNRLGITRGFYPAFGAQDLLASLVPRYGVAEAAQDCAHARRTESVHSGAVTICILSRRIACGLQRTVVESVASTMSG